MPQHTSPSGPTRPRTRGRLPGPPLPVKAGRVAVRPGSNDGTVRDAIWLRFAGDDWAAFDQLPSAIRHRLHEHAYDAWSVNALMLWRHYRRIHPTPERAQRALLRYLDHCERLERRAFAAAYACRHQGALPHDAACVDVLRYARTAGAPHAGR